MKIKYILLVSVMFFVASCNYTYKTSADNLFEQSKNLKPYPIDKVVEIIVNQDTANYTLIDIRNPHLYANGHILNAQNMPFKSLLGKQLKNLCNKNVLIYGNSADDAVTAALYLKSLGLDNVQPIGGGYEFLKSKIIDNFLIHSGVYDDEVPEFDYAKVMAEMAGSGNSSSQTTVTPPPTITVKRKKAGGNIGGCE